jgi:DeoR/GlpR family transcriptional regulator of sugar metabolism
MKTMLAIERRKFILNYLKEHGNITTNEVCRLLSVSPATARNDLNRLEKEKLILKTHGGASLLDMEDRRGFPVYAFAERQQVNLKEKEAITDAAVQLIEDDQCIILDASSTALMLARKLSRFNRLIVVTNGIYTMLELKDKPNITVIFIGGIVTRESGSVEGLLGQELLSHIHADYAFVSARGFTLKEGLTDFNIYEASLKKEMVKHSKKCAALLDSTKLESTSTANFCDAADVDILITDAGAREEDLEKYRQAGVCVEKVIEKSP